MTNKKIQSYRDQIEYAVNNRIADSHDIFNFTDTPFENQFNEYYRFCRENLDIHIKKGNITNGYFFYSNDIDINSKIQIKQNTNSIYYNIGLMNKCIVKYLENQDLKNFLESREPQLISYFDSPLSKLAFEINTQFTYYHELAHLFQFSKLETTIEYMERTDNEKYDIIKHKLEYNADIYSSTLIAVHIYQYIENCFSNSVNQINIIKTIEILGSCLLDYMLCFTNNDEIYFEKKSHPHTLIRLLAIIFNMTNHLSSNPNYREKGFELMPIPLFTGILEFHKELEKSGVFDTSFLNHIEQYRTKKENIISYISKIRNFEQNIGYTDATKMLNK